jgi:hypothetical protein
MAVAFVVAAVLFVVGAQLMHATISGAAEQNCSEAVRGLLFAAAAAVVVEEVLRADMYPTDTSSAEE